MRTLIVYARLILGATETVYLFSFCLFCLLHLNFALCVCLAKSVNIYFFSSRSFARVRFEGVCLATPPSDIASFQRRTHNKHNKHFATKLVHFHKYFIIISLNRSRLHENGKQHIRTTFFRSYVFFLWHGYLQNK